MMEGFTMKREASYQNIYNAIKQRISSGEYKVGELLPNEAKLCEMFHVSRTTIRRAVELLSRAGYLQAKQGYGTVILDYKTTQSLNAVTSISETLRKKGHIVRPKSTYIDMIEAAGQLALELDVKVGTPVTRVQRVELSDEKPIAIMKNYLVSDMVPDLQLFAGKFNALYLFLEERYGIVIERAYDRITARSANFSDSEMLQVPVGTALIAFSRICFQNDRPVCVDHLSIIGDRYEFELSLTGRNYSALQSVTNISQ